MSAGNYAYLALVLAAYAVFMGVLAVYWLRVALAAGKAKTASTTEVTPAHQPSPEVKPAKRLRKAA